MLVITRGYNGNRPHSNSVFVDVCSWNDLNKKRQTRLDHKNGDTPIFGLNPCLDVGIQKLRTELGSGARSERSGPMVTGGRNWERKDLKDLERV